MVDDDNDDVPKVASARCYLRDAMPLIYRTKGSFAMRFLHALERVLDPRVAIVDSLWAYVEPQLAPAGMVDEMARWLGLQPDDVPAGVARRELLCDVRGIARRRGTAAGLQSALNAAFPDLHPKVEDHGRAVACAGYGTRSAEDERTPSLAPNPGFTVRCSKPLSPSQRVAVEDAIARQLPLHVEHWSVRAPELGEPEQ